MKPPEKVQQGREWRWISPDYEWMHNEYVVQEKRIGQIGKEQNVSKTIVRRWLRIHHIELWGVRKGEKSPHWRGGCTPYRIRQRREILQEHGVPKECDWCKTTQSLEIHHRDGDKTNDQFENLQYLCRTCHMSLHSKGNKPHLELLLSRLKNCEKALRELGVDLDRL